MNVKIVNGKLRYALHIITTALATVFVFCFFISAKYTFVVNIVTVLCVFGRVVISSIHSNVLRVNN